MIRRRRSDWETLARELKRAIDGGRQIAPLAPRVPAFDVDAAYEVAHLLHQARLQEGARPVGRKIGFTNRNIWDEYGVYQPIWGWMYESTVTMAAQMPVTVPLRGLCEPRIEPEIVLHFARAPQPGADAAQILSCVDWIAHGFEIVQSHFAGWKFTAPDTIADNGLHGKLIVGPPRSVEQLGPDLADRLARFTVELYGEGRLRERGSGANVLGSPLAAVVAVLAQSPIPAPLAAGELVTTGTLTRALPVAPGQAWHTALAGIELPTMAVRFV
ncbi:MAG: decarboxylase [Burkholderiaceae bacterium]|nr:decarboxylase [Burkholderiaceae bacterium]